MLLAKGVLLMSTGHDRSLVPWFSLFATSGLVVASVALRRWVDRWRWLAWVGGGAATVGVCGIDGCCGVSHHRERFPNLRTLPDWWERLMA